LSALRCGRGGGLTFPTITPAVKKNRYRKRYNLRPEEPPFWTTHNARKRRSPVTSSDIDMYACPYEVIDAFVLSVGNGKWAMMRTYERYEERHYIDRLYPGSGGTGQHFHHTWIRVNPSPISADNPIPNNASINGTCCQ
jgi:hypothetical protein